LELRSIRRLEVPQGFSEEFVGLAGVYGGRLFAFKSAGEMRDDIGRASLALAEWSATRSDNQRFK
jgi:hypothetical protein